MNARLKNLRKLVFGSGGEKVPVLLTYALAQKAKGRLRYARLLLRYLQNTYGVHVSPYAIVGDGVCIPHPVGIVIGAGVRIGNNCWIYQNVTLGGGNLDEKDYGGYPVIGDGSVIFAGAVVVGAVSVGDNCIVGANAVVLQDVPSNHVAVGVPARVFARKSQVAHADS